ncbi:hypothetical protein Anapl_03202 [Anas platyrhynchos]|uniref:Uncharacterized protein n=1 Tax=Anas platyrhynchos TaxID=8839 RepID=R0JK12_ANAPL|nr:hypothetical protein Anapl_03202 [Anas platyrhynchos]
MENLGVANLAVQARSGAEQRQEDRPGPTLGCPFGRRQGHSGAGGASGAPRGRGAAAGTGGRTGRPKPRGAGGPRGTHQDSGGAAPKPLNGALWGQSSNAAGCPGALGPQQAPGSHSALPAGLDPVPLAPQSVSLLPEQGRGHGAAAEPWTRAGDAAVPISSVSPKPRLRFQALSALCSLPGEVERGEKFKTFIVSLLGVRQLSCGEKNYLNLLTYSLTIVSRRNSIMLNPYISMDFISLINASVWSMCLKGPFAITWLSVTPVISVPNRRGPHFLLRALPTTRSFNKAARGAGLREGQQILEMLLVKSTERYFSRSRNVFSQTDFLTVALDAIARARAAQGEKQTIKTFTYLILDRHLHKVASKIDCDLVTLSNGGIASTLSKDLARNDSFPLSVIGDSTNSFGSKEKEAAAVSCLLSENRGLSSRLLDSLQHLRQRHSDLAINACWHHTVPAHTDPLVSTPAKESNRTASTLPSQTVAFHVAFKSCFLTLPLESISSEQHQPKGFLLHYNAGHFFLLQRQHLSLPAAVHPPPYTAKPHAPPLQHEDVEAATVQGTATSRGRHPVRCSAPAPSLCPLLPSAPGELRAFHSFQAQEQIVNPGVASILLSMFQFGATGVQPSPAKTTHRLLCFERCCDKGWNLMTVPPPSTLASMKPLLDIIHQAHKSIIRVNQEGGKTELPLVPVGSKQLPSFL